MPPSAPVLRPLLPSVRRVLFPIQRSIMVQQKSSESPEQLLAVHCNPYNPCEHASCSDAAALFVTQPASRSASINVITFLNAALAP